MVTSLLLAFLALRSGLALRRSRIRRTGRTPEMRPRHLRFAKPAVVMVALGFIAGLGSWVWLRGGEVLGTFHGFIGVAVVTLFIAAAVVGHRIEAGESKAFDNHARLGGLALLRGAGAAVAGGGLLPEGLLSSQRR